MTSETRPQRKVLEGWVLSDKMDKTRVVGVPWTKQDPQYGKILHRTKKVHAHDEQNASKQGDRVRVMSTRPMSKTKFWRITDILEKK